MATLNGRVLLFGGISQFVTGIADPWSWGRHPVGPPSPAAMPAASRPAVANRRKWRAFGNEILLFGGSDASRTVLYDTWLWNGQFWGKPDTTFAAPTLRTSFGMATFGANVVVFGGSSTAGPLADLYAWDGGTWNATTETAKLARMRAPAMRWRRSVGR